MLPSCHMWMTRKNEMPDIETEWAAIAKYRTTDPVMGLTEHFQTLGLWGRRGWSVGKDWICGMSREIMNTLLSGSCM